MKNSIKWGLFAISLFYSNLLLSLDFRGGYVTNKDIQIVSVIGLSNSTQELVFLTKEYDYANPERKIYSIRTINDSDNLTLFESDAIEVVVGRIGTYQDTAKIPIFQSPRFKTGLSGPNIVNFYSYRDGQGKKSSTEIELQIEELDDLNVVSTYGLSTGFVIFATHSLKNILLFISYDGKVKKNLFEDYELIEGISIKDVIEKNGEIYVLGTQQMIDSQNVDLTTGLEDSIQHYKEAVWTYRVPIEEASIKGEMSYIEQGDQVAGSVQFVTTDSDSVVYQANFHSGKSLSGLKISPRTSVGLYQFGHAKPFWSRETVSMLEFLVPNATISQLCDNKFLLLERNSNKTPHFYLTPTLIDSSGEESLEVTLISGEKREKYRAEIIKEIFIFSNNKFLYIAANTTAWGKENIDDAINEGGGYIIKKYELGDDCVPLF